MKQNESNKISSIVIKYVLFIFVITSCNKPDLSISTERFIEENLNNSFNSWCSWSIQQRDKDYYIIDVNNNSSETINNRLIFFKNDSIDILLKDTVSSSFDKKYTINTISQKDLDKFNYRINVSDLISHINYMIKYNLYSVVYYPNPDRIYFKAKDMNTVYFFNLQERKPYSYDISYNLHWFYSSHPSKRNTY